MRIRVKYMLWLRDKAGVGEEEIQVEDGLSLKELIDKIGREKPGLGKVFDNVFSRENPIIILVNGVKAEPNHVLRNGDEVVFLPPVSGG